jgi:E3 ubiquitin-protein ligase TRIP12
MLQDAKVVDHACMALSHIASAYAKNAELLTLLSSGGLVGQALQLVSLNESGGAVSQLSLNTYYSLIKLLATCAASSPAVAVQLLEGGVLRVVCTLLGTSALLPGAGAGTGNSSMLRSADQLYEVMALVTELLPALPEATTVVAENLAALPGGSPPPPVPGGKDTTGSKDASPEAGAAPADKGAGVSGSAGKDKGAAAAGKQDERAVYLSQHPEAVQTLAQEVLPLLLQLYTATVITQVRTVHAIGMAG